MKRHRTLLAVCLLLAGLITMIACHKSADAGNSSNPNTVQPDQLVTASLQGRVLDENGLPVKGAAVTSGTTTTTTDVNGIFRFSNIQLYSRFGFVSVTKPGYFTGSRTIVTNPGAVNFVRIDLLPRVSKGSFVASAGGTVTIQTGNTVTFAGGTVVNAVTNAVYSGNVKVYATYLDPTDASGSNHQPGSLRGITTDKKEMSLQSFGMLTVELEGDAGEKLQIASGKMANLTTSIPVSLQTSAPTTIPMWYFNDSTGKWMEEGSATRQGNNYVGQTGHFTWWNLDVPYTPFVFKATLIDQHGNPLPYSHVAVVYDQSTDIAYQGYTDSSGFIQGYVPKGGTYVMQVYDDCNNVIGGANFGPVLTDQDLGAITININNAPLTITGSVVDCNNNPVANGYVNVFLEGLNRRAVVTNGNFTLSINRCSAASAQAALTPDDLGASQQGAVTSVTVTTGNVNVGQLSACGVSSDQYIIYTAEGVTYTVSSPTGYFEYLPSGTTLPFPVKFNGSGNSIGVGFYIPEFAGVGNYNSIGVAFFDGGGNVYSTGSTTTMQYSVTEYGPVDGFITGTFIANLTKNSSSNLYAVTGSFRFKRTQ